MSDWQVVGVAAVIYTVQLAVSRYWVRHHRYGPIEWVLRRATYGRQRNGAASTPAPQQATD
ncbi:MULTISPECIES: DUF418 domain-containing protein [unclassified Mycolicibacterium]|uniref:DUF418 domain-containing protein n=1 Tax=unclassified Mycolicibacterium TaxID=2636767 RepID=UPI0012DC894D|nr:MULTISPECIES: DUF418 domain-containing protein [unclassified Mycolicibacterium]MUL82654.1 DUF418 domain-containing protein [Mycolicibacterium sp. CBMA 329]MUL88989.1 DUF418 domain-containing protein [Mycolicibacterium sp. CBMA 331]MUL97556.1 DUF418 domain-containing protein [Mycolicibacterium sp. CBMA 334]MUM38505.1 DUF418 domain-containing protein [Mycolicibacterium sp. CBMA 247]MUM45053.1 DUF418 domain-containing protein [Mycolicibacterium sp. CBMA 294]